MIALPSRGGGEDVIAAVLMETGVRAGAVPGPAAPTRSLPPLCWWVLPGGMHKEINQG